MLETEALVDFGFKISDSVVDVLDDNVVAIAGNDDDDDDDDDDLFADDVFADDVFADDVFADVFADDNVPAVDGVAGDDLTAKYRRRRLVLAREASGILFVDEVCVDSSVSECAVVGVTVVVLGGGVDVGSVVAVAGFCAVMFSGGVFSVDGMLDVNCVGVGVCVHDEL